MLEILKETDTLFLSIDREVDTIGEVFKFAKTVGTNGGTGKVSTSDDVEGLDEVLREEGLAVKPSLMGMSFSSFKSEVPLP